MEKTSDKFGKILRELRRGENLTQENFSKVLDTDRSNIANYENGKRLPPLDSLIKIAAFFNVSIDYLVFGQKTQKDESENPYNDNISRELMAENTMLMENQVKLHDELAKKDEEIKMLKEMIEILKKYNNLLESKLKKDK